MLAGWVVLLAVLGTVGTLLFQGIPIYLAARMPRVDPGDRLPLPRTPRVSVIVTARNEELDLPGCLDTLLAQSYSPLEILVVDGGSTDRTRDVAHARAPRVRLIEEPPLPAGWVGKNWGCFVGAAQATGDYLLFTDADVRYHPDAVRATVAWALAEDAQLTSLAPRIEMVGFWEQVILPFYTQVVLTYFRAPRVNATGSSAAVANGQFLLVERSAYEAVGGHAALRGFVLEDVRLAQLFRARGYRLRMGWAPDLLSTRMYRDRREMAEGLSKNIHGTTFSAIRQVGSLSALIGFYLLPLAVLPVGLLGGDPLVSALGLVLYVALFGKHAGFARAVRGSAAHGLLYPLAVGFYCSLVVRSIVRGLSGQPIHWKGRAYALDPTGSAEKD